MAKPWAKAFYASPAWIATRAAYMTERNGLCERCQHPGLIVHHRKYLRQEDLLNPARTLSFANLELLCIDCHNAEHLRSPVARRSVFDLEGNLLPPVDEGGKA